jgi:hypothetical protein
LQRSLCGKENFAGSPNPAQANAIRETLDRLAATQGAEPEKPDTASLERALREAVDKFGSAPDDGARQASSIEALSAARNLASRIGDDSNLTLDPDLDSYYVQDIVVAKIPALLSEIGELQSAFANPASAPSPPESRARLGIGRHDPLDSRRGEEVTASPGVDERVGRERGERDWGEAGQLDEDGSPRLRIALGVQESVIP